jgi:hypothetical protein
MLILNLNQFITLADLSVNYQPIKCQDSGFAQTQYNK